MLLSCQVCFFHFILKRLTIAITEESSLLSHTFHQTPSTHKSATAGRLVLQLSAMHFSVICLLPLAGLLQATVIPAVGRTKPLAAHFIGLNGGVILPEGPDGIFMVNLGLDNSTEATITTLELFEGDISERSDSPRSEQVKRDLPIASSGCTNSWHNRDDYATVSRAFGQGCDRGAKIDGNSIMYYRVGSSIAYGCSHGGQNPCSSNEFYQSDVFLDNKCGQWRSGWIWMEDWLKGYGRVLNGEEACGRIVQ